MSSECSSQDSCCACSGGKPEPTINRNKIMRMAAGAAILAAGIVLEHVFRANEYILLAAFVSSYLILGGDVVFRAVKNISKGLVFSEHFLMAIATIGAFAIGEYAEAVAVMLFYQVGEFFQELAVGRSKRNITKLMDIRPDRANLLVDGVVSDVRPDSVRVGDLIVVKPGERIPLDGVVVEGESMLDTAALTGESVPRRTCASDAVLSGCVNQNGVLTIEVTQSYGESTVSRIIDLVEHAAAKKAPTEKFITKFARYYTPVVVILALLIAVLPPLLADGAWHEWLRRGLILLVISCPCALVISIPLGFFGGISGAARKGILVKGGNYLEALKDPDTVVFDKTGTLTQGVFKVTEIIPANGFEKDGLLEAAADAEAYSTHPIAFSILSEYERSRGARLTGGTAELTGQPDGPSTSASTNLSTGPSSGLSCCASCSPSSALTSSVSSSPAPPYPPYPLAHLTNFNEMAGYGVSVVFKGRTIFAGNNKLMEKAGVVFDEVANTGTKVYVATDGIYMGCIVISDEIKPDSYKAVAALKASGVKRIVMLTGDDPRIAEAIAAKLGIGETYGGLLPHEKVEKVEDLNKQKRENGKLVFVGDGINDAPVLAMADVGVAMGGLGSDAAIEAADVVLMTDEPHKLNDAIRVARFTSRVVWQNIVFALGVKAVFLALGAVGVATMWEAVFADVGVALLAVLNAMRVMRK